MGLYKARGYVDAVYYADDDIDAQIMSDEILLREIMDGGGIKVEVIDNLNKDCRILDWENCYPWNLDEYITVKEYIDKYE